MMKQRVVAMIPRLMVMLAAVAILGGALGAGSALADKAVDGIHHHAEKNGNGGNGGNGGTQATLTVSPNPVIAGGDLTISGSGFKPDQWIYFSTTCYGSFNVAVDGAGDTSFTRPAPIGAATCTFDAYQNGGKGKNKFSLMATLTFQVVEP